MNRGGSRAREATAPARPAARALVIVIMIALALALACGRAPAPPPATGEELLAPYAPIRFGEPVVELVARRPALAPSGWTDGDRATLIDPTLEAGLEIETTAGRVAAAGLTFADARAGELRRDLARRLGPGRSCGGLPEELGLYRPHLHRLVDGTGVTVLDKGARLTVHAARPATRAFDDAFSACDVDAGTR